MSVDLAKLPADEEIVRQAGNALFGDGANSIQNVLDALNWFRCKAKFAEQELARANADQSQVVTVPIPDFRNRLLLAAVSHAKPPEACPQPPLRSLPLRCGDRRRWDRHSAARATSRGRD
jgi:hypothetical protein